LKTKDEALNCFKTYKAKVENQLEKKIKCFRSDHDGEYFSNEFDLFCVKYGIIHERMPPYLPPSNGVAERKNCTSIDWLIPYWTLLNYLRHGEGQLY
jgi:transposase InsO family protein